MHENAENRAVAADAARSCLECGLCERVQDEGCGCRAGMWGPFASGVTEQVRGGSIGEETQRELFSCALCGACTVSCPAGIDAASVVREGRAAFHQMNPEAAWRWRPVQADLAGNVFASLRAWRGIRYQDALAGGAQECESLFFPGCTLSTYAPELTNATWDFLREAGRAHGLTVLCCGKLLWSIGLEERSNAYAEKLGERLAACGVRRIVVGCPNCHQALGLAQDAGLVDAGIELQPLPQVLAEEGLRVPSEAQPGKAGPSYSVHDSCPDRNTLLFGNAVRAMLPESSLREMKHTGRETLCCGSGGTVSYYDAGVCAQRRSRRVAEFDDCGADCLVTSCTSCTNSFLRASSTLKVRHYLELLFGIDIDWKAHRRAMASFADAGGYGFAREEDNAPILA